MSNLEMHPIQLTVFHDNSTGDSRQVPAASASVATYRQGATVTANTSCFAETATAVPVANSGRLRTGDYVSLLGAAAEQLIVGAVGEDGQSLVLANVGGSTVALTAGDRLLASATPRLVVATLTSVGASSITDVPVRMFQETLYSTLYPNGDTDKPLTVDAIIQPNAVLQLGNDSSYGDDIPLSVGDVLTNDAGDPIVIVQADAIVYDHGDTNVPIAGVMYEPPPIMLPNGNTSHPMTLVGVSSDGLTVTVNNPGSAFTLHVNDELAAPPFQTFKDASGAIANGALTLNSQGNIIFHTHETRVDCVVSSGGLTTARLFPDCLGGWVRGGLSVINARDYNTVQDAIDALPREGGTVVLPAGTYDMVGTLYTPCDRPCHLIGEGAMIPDQGGTALKWQPGEDEVVGMVRLRGDGSSIRNLTLINTGTAVPDDDESLGFGVMLGRRDVEDAHPAPGSGPGNEYERMGSVPATNCVLDNVTILGAQGWGLTIPGFGFQSNGEEEPHSVPAGFGQGGTLSFWVTINSTRVFRSKKFGNLFTGGGCTTLWFDRCAFIQVGEGDPFVYEDNYYAFISQTVQAAFSRCTFEGHSPAADPGKPWVKLWGSESTVFETCWFEEDGRPTEPYLYEPTYFIRLANGSKGGAVRNCHFVRGGDSGGRLRILLIDEFGGQGLAIIEPYAVVTSALMEGGAYHDPAHIDLGGDTNLDISVVGSGAVRQQVDLVSDFFPIQYAGISASSGLQGALVSKAVCRTDAEVSQVPNIALANSTGNIVFNIGLGPIGTLMTRSLSSPGSLGGWMLGNNVPGLSATQIDSRESAGMWSNGDMVYNTDAHQLQIRLGDTWHGIWGGP
jgi:hypothetical protein